MLDRFEEFDRLKNTVEEAQQKADRAVGALEQITKQLKQEFDCKSIKEAEKKLLQLKKQEETEEQDFDKAMRIFKKKWGNKISI